MSNKPTNEEKSFNHINEPVLEQLSKIDIEDLERFRLIESSVSPSRARMFNDNLSKLPPHLDSDDTESE